MFEASAKLNISQPQRATETGSTASAEAERALMQRISFRDVEAFSELYDRLAKPLFSMALHILQSREEAEETVQEVFLKIWNQATAYESVRGTPFGWAATMTRHKAIDRLRSAGRRERLHRDVESETSRAFPEAANENAVTENEDARRMQTVLARLPEEQREAIHLAYFSGLTQNEIAEQLQQPLGTIKARIRRGLLKLRNLLGGQS